MTATGKASYYTLGCKLNFSETSQLSRILEDAGFETVPFGQACDIAVINTCSVTENADKRCRKVISEAKRISPNARVVVVGCYAQLKPETIAKIPGVYAVLGAADKFGIAEVARSTQTGGWIKARPLQEANVFIPSHSSGERTRVFMKVQDGCDYTCAFCTIPLARGASRSPQIIQLVNQAVGIAATGVKEIVLTGVNIGDYGLSSVNGDNERFSNFYDLIRALDVVEGIERFRISSIEPNLLSDEIIDFVATSKRFVPHFHIPLQSGSNEILGKMRRRYKREVFASRLKQIKEAMPNACIGVDVIVGFPGETDEHFEETYQFLVDVEPSYLHVFTYSERSNTHALSLGQPVPYTIRAERSTRLHILSDKLKRAFYNQFTNTEQSVLWETGNAEEGISGFTQNYLKVYTLYNPELTGDIQKVQLVSFDSETISFHAGVTKEVSLFSELEVLN
jgi:threonylcarbamoyladenosine tRNA methylthiotransferase MtaB